MGGIYGAVSRSRANVVPIVIDGLKRMLFRGYDTAGIAVLTDGELKVYKDVGRVSEVVEKLKLYEISSWIALGHTRFSTHGRPHVENAHPHTDCRGKLAVVGDGAIANYERLRDEAIMREHRVVSRCDFEIVAHILEEEIERGETLLRAIARAARGLEGFYSFAVLDSRCRCIAVYTSLQPVYLGIGQDLFLVSSTKSALYGYADRFTELRGSEIAIVSQDGIEVFSSSDLRPIEKVYEPLAVDAKLVEKDGYPHHMLREIYEIPFSILRTLSAIQEKYLSFASRLLQGAKDVYIIADGTSLHAGFVGSYYLSELANVSPIVVSAAEFPLYYVENVGPGSVVIAISQSGETGDVIRSVYEAKLRGATIMGITNFVGSRLASMSNLYLPIAAGPELAVPATKTFVSTLVVLYLVALKTARDIGKVSMSEMREKIERLKSYAIELREHMPKIDRLAIEAAKGIAKCRSGYVVSRGITYPIAMEGALKLKEAAYVHAEGMEAGEFKHGPIVLVEKEFFTVFIVPVEKIAAEATYPLIETARDREATVVAIGFDNDEQLKNIRGITTITVPPTDRHSAPIALTIPIQFIAYRLGELLGRPIDAPRYLTKAVTQ